MPPILGTPSGWVPRVIGVFLYLSSQGLGPAPHLLRRHARGDRAFVIANALDDLPSDVRQGAVTAEVADLVALGFAVDELDLRDGFDGDIGGRLRAADLLWVLGGNTFTLCRAFTASGAVPRIRERVADGLLYAGYSAGAVAAGPDLVGIDQVDDPATRPAGYPHGVRPTTLALLDRRIVPHVDPRDPHAGVMGDVIASLQRLDLDHVRLCDGQAFVVHAGRHWIEQA